jgi:hypothetical protein
VTTTDAPEEPRVVNLLRENEQSSAIIRELMQGADYVMQVDCASMKVAYAVNGWFVFPHGTVGDVLPDIKGAA